MPKHALAGPLPGGLLVVGHGDAVVVVGDGGGLGQVEGEGTRPLSREGFRQVKEKSEQKSESLSLLLPTTKRDSAAADGGRAEGAAKSAESVSRQASALQTPTGATWKSPHSAIAYF